MSKNSVNPVRLKRINFGENLLRTAFLLALFLIFSGYSAQPKVIPYDLSYTQAGKHTVYVVSHGWHTGFVVPAAKIKK